jgi:hypothetical protein
MWDIFKSREQKLYESGIKNGLSHIEATRRASGALRCDLNRDGQEVFMATGDSVTAHRRQNGAATCGFKGIAKDVFLQTGDAVAARRAERLANSYRG